jgi:hypothetical protein
MRTSTSFLSRRPTVLPGVDHRRAVGPGVYQSGPTTDLELSDLVRKIDHQRVLGQFFDNLLDQLDVLVHSSPFGCMLPNRQGRSSLS